MIRRLPSLRGLALLLMFGCASTAPISSPASEQDRAAPVAPPKTITVAALRPVKALGPWDTSGAGGTNTMHNIHSASVMTSDSTGVFREQLLTTRPSLDDGTITILPDARMQTIWKVRPDVKWHDGSPFTADDLVFTQEVLSHPEIATQKSVQLQAMESIEARDPLTAVVTWKAVFFQPLYMGLREFWPLPRHLLGEPFQGDKKAFANLPYWTTEYIHLGPFRVIDYGMGENLILERFDQYFLGRPKVDKIIIRIIPDPNALFASLQAHAIDIAADSTFPFEVFIGLRDEWKLNGGGIVVERQADWPFLLVQQRREFARPVELSTDARIRRGLYRAIDRPALRAAILPGVSGTDGDSFMPDGDPRALQVGKPYARYPYDPARASQELVDAGWVRGADGRLLSASGEQVHLPLRTTVDSQREVAIVAQFWRQLGINVTEEVVSGALVQDKEYAATFPGVVTAAHGSGDFIFAEFNSREAASPQNRYTGINASGYANPALDRLIDRLYGTLDERAQSLLMKDMGDILADDLPALPLYFRVKLAAVASPVRALEDFSGTQGPGLASRNAHLWDRD